MGLGKRAVGLGQGLTWFDYVRLAFYPNGLVFDYGANLPLPTIGALLLCGAILATLLALARLGSKPNLPWAVPVAAFFLVLAPTSSIVPVGGPAHRREPPLSAAARAHRCHGDRGRKKIPRLGLGVLGGCAVALGVLAHARNHDFRSEISIWSDTVNKRPDNERAVVYLAEAHRAAGNPSGAVETLLAALRRKPDSAELHNNAATYLVAIGRTQEALGHFETALRLKPDLPATHGNYGIVLWPRQTPPPLWCR